MSTAELYDELQAMFGIGDWSEASGVPWFKARMNEIGKLKRTLKARHISEDDVYLAAQYARRNGIAIVATWRLFELIPLARKARADRTDRLQRVIDQALDAGDHELAQQLMSMDRNDKAAVEVVLEAQARPYWDDKRAAEMYE